MFGYIKKHKEAKRLLQKGEDLLSKARFTNIEEWEYLSFCTDARKHANTCLKANLPNDSALLFLNIFLVTCIYEGEDPTTKRTSIEFLGKTILIHNGFNHKSQTVQKKLMSYYSNL